MKGFEAQYKSIIDYIVRITFHIWEEKNIGYILIRTVGTAVSGRIWVTIWIRKNCC
ncbi:MAG: hypothetical protein CM1200mP1_13990 [Candidatus Neomarinimicrobiota bacterium]|nr:MAG: hypothetical protein CM1200mP1_13990 [Candidatus Neomarinimicrobiota bacterium]